MRRLDRAAGESLAISWNGRRIECRVGDSVAAALYAAGIRRLASSRKFHRPIGLSGIYPAGSLLRIDGMPHQRADRIVVRDGMDVREQNVWPSSQFDLLRLMRLLPRKPFEAGFEHPAWLPSGTRRFDRWEALLRYLAGIADPPDSKRAGAPIPGDLVAFDVAIVGGGPAGRAAAIDEARAGKSVLLVSRGHTPGAGARAMGAALPDLPPSVRIVAAAEAFGLYRRGTLLGIAPFDGSSATLVEANEIVLATGRRSCPPLVPGIDLPGVLDLKTALAVAHDHAVAPGHSVLLVGTGDLAPIAARFAARGVRIVEQAPAASLDRVLGWNEVTGAVVAGRRIACDAVVHAGPWRSDPSLSFQAAADGGFRMLPGAPSARLRIVGSAAEASEPILCPRHGRSAFVCPCMDVTQAEIEACIAETQHVEELKRLTSCGMGPCQGFPCWDNLAAMLERATGAAATNFGHPTFRPPRAALTLAQAAGLADLVAPEPAARP
ncbi:MAG: 2Fe-2S iron-sulfur cluster-binding protein [Dongiaceae bacterium]